MSVNIKDSSRPNDLNPVSGRVPDNVYKYDDALSLEEISASTDLTNKIPTAEAVGRINTNLKNLIIKQSFVSSSPASSIASGNTGQSTINIIVPDGYELLFCDVVDETSGTIVDYYSITDNVLQVRSRNIGSGNKTCSPRANCLFIKTT